MKINNRTVTLKKGFFTAALVSILSLLFSMNAAAQTASVSGKVQLVQADGTTMPVGGATIEVIRVDIKAAYPSTRTNQKGDFAFAGLPLGAIFKLCVSATGAKPVCYPNVKAGMENVQIMLMPDGQTEKRETLKDDSEFLRKILINQPDFTALQEESWTYLEGNLQSKKTTVGVTKFGNRRRIGFRDGFLIFEIGKSILDVSTDEKNYAEIQDNAATEKFFNELPESIVKNPELKFKLGEEEKIGEYTCVYIKVSYKNSSKEGLPSYCVAPELNNLIIYEGNSWLTYPQRLFSRELKEISLKVSEEMFQIPTGYKKTSNK